MIRYCCAKRRVTIVMYHNPKADTFEKHLKYLSRRYNLITISALVNAFQSGNFKKLPKYALLITIDDGWKENYDLLPIIKEYKCRPIIFLASDIINTQRRYWWTICNVTKAKAFKKMPNSERQKILKEKYSYSSNKEYPGERQALNLQELNEMKDYVDFGLHTATHPILTRCTTSEKKDEINNGKQQLEELLNLRIETFSYPNGDYDAETKEILKENGITIARTTDVGWTSLSSDQYQLRVTGVSDAASENKLVAEITGLSMFIQYLLKGCFNGTKEKNY